MPRMFVGFKNCLLVAGFLLAWASLCPGQKSGDPADGANKEAEQWYTDGLAAWDEAVALDKEAKAQLAEQEAAEEAGSRNQKRRSGDESEPLPVPDFASALGLFKRSAEAGYAKAALKVSELLLAGDGVPKDTVGAFEWAMKAAEMGDAEGQLLAASKFEEGRGTKKSLPRALKLYEQALAQGSPVARMKVAGLFDRGDPGVDQDRARALPLFQAAAEDGDLAAIYMIGLYLQRGYVVPEDAAAASQWYLRAAEIGEARAQRKLAMRYFRGTGIEQDPVEALKWCELALTNPGAGVETTNLAREYKEAIQATVTPRKVEQAMREVARFEVKKFRDISLPPLPYTGPALVYHALSDTSGNQLEAAVIGLQPGAVVLERKSDGTRFTVPLKRLSEVSRELIEGLRKQ